MKSPERWKIKAELCKRSFFDFFVEFWPEMVPDDLVLNWHIEYLCSQLEEAGKRLFKRESKESDIIINIPPGTSKSTIATIAFPAWCWVNDPTLRIISGSWDATLAVSQAVKSRDVMKSEKFKKYYGHLFRFKSDANNKTSYENSKKGDRVATSVGGTIIGKHAHLIIIDDPLNPKAAASDSGRKSANEWLDRAMSSRKVNKKVTLTILIMQRLHELDCTGHLLAKKKKKLRHICLPATDQFPIHPPELKERYVNGLLDPVRLDAEVLEEQKADLGSYAYAGQMGQQPAPEEGGLIKKAWFEIVPVNYEHSAKPRDFTLDTAYTEKEVNDESAMLSYYIHDNCLYITGMDEFWLEFPELVKHIPMFCDEQGYTNQSKVYCEPKASGKSLVQTIKRNTLMNIIEDKAPTEDKVTRVRNVSAPMEAKRVKLIEGEWNDTFLTRVASFPTAKNKGIVDCLSMAVGKLIKPKATFRSAF